MIDDVENEVISKLLDIMSSYDLIKLRFNPYPIFQQLTKVINEDLDFYHLLVNASVSVTIFDKVRKMLKERILETFSAESMRVDNLALSFALDFTATGLLGV